MIKACLCRAMHVSCTDAHESMESHSHHHTEAAWQGLEPDPEHARAHSVASRVGPPVLAACSWVAHALGRGPCPGVAQPGLASLP